MGMKVGDHNHFEVKRLLSSYASRAFFSLLSLIYLFLSSLSAKKQMVFASFVAYWVGINSNHMTTRYKQALILWVVNLMKLELQENM